MQIDNRTKYCTKQMNAIGEFMYEMIRTELKRTLPQWHRLRARIVYTEREPMPWTHYAWNYRSVGNDRSAFYVEVARPVPPLVYVLAQLDGRAMQATEGVMGVACQLAGGIWNAYPTEWRNRRYQSKLTVYTVDALPLKTAETQFGKYLKLQKK